jgi:cytochrome c oxidase assembly protein subunit 15
MAPEAEPAVVHAPARDALPRLAWLTLAFTLLVIVWGAYVRASKSGAGCGSHWPLCNGEALHLPASSKTAIELTHRLTSGLDGLLAVAIAVLGLRKHGGAARPASVRWAAAATLFFMLTEGAVGALLVKAELVAENRSAMRALVISLHLVNTFFLLAAMAATAVLSSLARARPSLTLRLPARELVLGLAAGATAMLLVGTTGAVAALGDTLFPAASLAEGVRADLDETAHFLVRLRTLHPLFAVGTAALLVALRGLVAVRAPSHRAAASALGHAVLAQLAVGTLNWLLLAPTWMQLVHLVVADVVWLLFVRLAVLTCQEPATPRAAGRGPTAAPGSSRAEA